MIRPGVVPRGTGVDVGVVSANATAIEFCLFEGENERRVRLTGRTGELWHAHIPGIATGARYGLRAHGPWAPYEGHRFNPAKLLLDPYAMAIDRPFRLHPTMFGHRDGEALLPDDADSAAVMPKAIVSAPSLLPPAKEITPWSSSVIYELHVRGFTMRHPDIPPALRGTFAGLAHPAAIAHLTALGITAVELLPVASCIEERHLAAQGLTNYWGYNQAGFLAPDPRLAPGGWPEIATAVAALAEAGIETILDVVLNHTGEGDAWGPTLSLRGLDNALYYRLPPDALHRTVDDTGCGNTLALDRPAMLGLAMDSLRAWALHAGVHGFRFDLATTLGRRAQGFDPHAPLLSAIAQDPVLAGLKLIAEPWDIGPGGYQLGQFPAAWGEWNDRFRDDARRFWRGDARRLGALATRLAGSEDVFQPRHRPSRGVNFITAHDGFTLADLVSFAHKHNQANGEQNRDGTDNNLSWNNGAEGPTADPAITTARLNDQRALLATLLLARGTPMLAMGSEFGQSQGGNNNPYAQDSNTAWLDWAAADTGLLAFTQRLIAARRSHKALEDDCFLTGTALDASLLPDVAWLRPDGAAMREADWDGDTLVMVLTTPSSRVCVAVNRGPHSHALVLPDPRDDFAWRVLADSADPRSTAPQLSPRAVILLAERPGPASARPDDAAMQRLAAAAGIAPDWWEVDGTHHTVSPDTTRALLASMGLPAATGGDARASLADLADRRQRRPLPPALVARTGQDATLPMTHAPGLSRRPVWLEIALENGETRHHRAGAEDGTLNTQPGIDGRPCGKWRITLPPLPPGRHRITREDAPEAPCLVTIAPTSCYLPLALAHGRRFGVAAQLYALRSAGDQGIGDFSTLRLLAQATARAGGAAIGLNPLHMLFPTDRARASPYHPSDRRFLDPIYLDIGNIDDGLEQSPADLHGPPAPRTTGAVDYPLVWARKSAWLEQRYQSFAARERHAPNTDFQAFIARGGQALQRFAVFQVIAAQRRVTWPLWPAALRDPSSPAVAEIAAGEADQVRYHQYLQFLCDRQLARSARNGLEIGLIRDLAVGGAPDGAEAWANAETLARGVSIGAPPDPFSAEGQVWNLPPPNPIRLTEDGYAGFFDLVEANLRHAGGLRIDHVMGLSRLFWVPDGGRGRDGAYVAAPLDDLLGQLALASNRAQALIVGEDLGTVPDGLREKLAEDAILSYRVLLLEREGPGFKLQSAYPRNAMASVSTHDLPTLTGWWTGADIAERAQLGLTTAGQSSQAMEQRETERQALEQITGAAAQPDLIDITTSAHAFVAGTHSCLVMAQADDLGLEPSAVNLPGTDTERPNWRRRLATEIPALLETPAAQSILRVLLKSGREGEARTSFYEEKEAKRLS